MSNVRERIAQLTQLVEAGESTDADEAVLAALLDADREHTKAAEYQSFLNGLKANVAARNEAVKAAATPAAVTARNGGAVDLRATFTKAADAFTNGGAKTGVIQPVTVADGLSFTTGADSLQPVTNPVWQYVHQLYNTQVVGTRAFTYWRQGTTSGAAALTPAGDLKPVIGLTGESVVDETHVVAAIAGPVAEQDLADIDVLSSLIAGELAHQVALEVDRLTLYGTGEITGVANDSGVPLVPYDGDGFTSLRNGLATVEVAGYRPTLIVLHPLDAAALDVAKDGQERFLSPAPPHGAPIRSYWGVTAMAHPMATQGVALLGQMDMATLVVRETVEVAASREFDGAFRRNQQYIRAETRVGFAVRAAAAFARVELEDGGAGS